MLLCLNREISSYQKIKFYDAYMYINLRLQFFDIYNNFKKYTELFSNITKKTFRIVQYM
jgi:hypothetical protein